MGNFKEHNQLDIEDIHNLSDEAKNHVEELF